MKAHNRRFWSVFNSKFPHGQGLVETALFFPILLIVLSGLVEMGFMLNDYMVIQDAARNAARYGADNDYRSHDDINSDTDPNYCNNTLDFFRQLGCVVNQELAHERPDVKIILNREDDVIISVFSVVGYGDLNPTATVTERYPIEYGEEGWSEALDYSLYGIRNQVSKFTSAEISAKLSDSAPSTGYLLVEVYYHYPQKLKLPWLAPFLPDPVELHTYAIMPLSSAEPTPTTIASP